MSKLALHEGYALLSATQAMLKGALEAEIEISLIAGAKRGGFAPLFKSDRTGGGRGDEITSNILLQHQLRIVEAFDTNRAIALALQEARAGRAAFALIPNEDLDESMDSMAAIGSFTGAMVIVLEDSPETAPVSCPRTAVERLDFYCLEPCDLQQLRESMEQALRLSKATKAPAAVVVHDSIWRSLDTLLMEPNRVLGSVEAILAKPRRKQMLRWTDAGGPLRIARRLELNKMRSTPNPGEKMPVGFITIGPVDRALMHITNTLELHGRVPVLQLGLLHPIDASAVSRILTRCQHVVVLEPRPGSIERAIVTTAEAMRHKGEQPAQIWGSELPANATDERATFAFPSLNPEDPSAASQSHPSILVRRILHLLHSIRPLAQVASQLVQSPPLNKISISKRDATIGSSAAFTELRRMLVDVDQWLREQAPLEERNLPASTLALDGVPPATKTPRVISVEIWGHRRFQHQGLAALTHLARESRPSIMLICEVASEMIRDLERLARGAVPAEFADRVTLETANFSDRNALRELIREATLIDRFTVIIVRDGPPPQFDALAIERSFAEIDQLGFEPRQRLVRAADAICNLRTPPVDADELAPALDERQSTTLENEFVVEPVRRAGAAKFSLRVRPLWEELEVVRSRPPIRMWMAAAHLETGRLSAPVPRHAKQSQWRVHLAGFRGQSPGLAAMVLCEAGRLMGYHVRALYDDAPLSEGLHAWAQVLFTHTPPAGGIVPLTAAIPFGEADLIVGLHSHETHRALGLDPELHVASPHRTFGIVDLPPVHTESEEAQRQKLRQALSQAVRSDVGLYAEISAACRRWFHTDRVTDMALLGAAFQMGLIPLSADSLETALSQIEAAGNGRVREVFEFGRVLAVDQGLLQATEHEHEEDVARLSRRIVLALSRGTWGSGKRARNFSNLLAESLQSMPGLAETAAGRQARRDFVLACHRCRIWGGFAMAEQYAVLVRRLYSADHGENGRALTRAAILPLAESMLIRDLLYIAATATSLEQRRTMRERMNVKLARGDRLERRYLTRCELTAFGRRYRADVRTSDWPARTASVLRRLVPLGWRGTRRERELRDYIIDFIRRATDGASTNYEFWLEAMQRLHHSAVEDRLRGMALAEIKMMLEPGTAD